MRENLFHTKIGIIGGGQLGKMMILEAKKMGFYVVTLDPTLNCPSHSISDRHIIGNFNDEVKIRELAEATDVITYEFEHIHSDLLIQLEKEGYCIYPSPQSLKKIQNKYIQKTILLESCVSVPKFMEITSTADMIDAGNHFGYPFLLKTCTGGYDGKGNMVVHDFCKINECFSALGNGVIPLMAEEFIDYSMEISVLACRGINGEIVVYPACENIHENQILHMTKAPAAISEKEKNQSMKIAHDVMEIFKGVGMFCVEMFVHKDGNIYLNEVAPRPHNSGHYTIEACITSQFENHIRAITGLPLGDTRLISPAVMINLLGEKNYIGTPHVEGVEHALSIPGVHLHLYGKEETKPQRKMGHLTVTHKDIQIALEKAETASRLLKIIS